jgi:flagellar protein FlbD
VTDIGANPFEHAPMIQLTRLNHIPLILNSDLIEHIEVTPDTIIVLTSGEKFVVTESVDRVIDKIIEFRRMIASGVECPLLKARAGAISKDRLSDGN